ncbi:diadenylate cyclase CdaA [Brucepastera parasyntrophica]|uniref:diadenylate cyclase CdaA n=1 Tax=Brucepastera parasyntrophica TaxID=2880008 RepID=UPI00210E333A|nr:diadenylate cyclase CdaA [Brucepastera parasyntrophica]ULQ59710.1 diadenylate cyclase CdaA [Brucepastera parasyntrophica]
MEIIKRLSAIYSYIQPFLDVLILAGLLYTVYRILLKTQAIHLLKGAISVLAIYAVAFILRLNTLLWLLNILAPGLLVAVVIVFQPELRKIFLKIGQSDWLRVGKRSKHSHLDSVLTAAEILSNQRRGMLAVFIRRNTLKDITETGTRLNADLSSSLIVTIFGHDTPLHDGAVIIQGGHLIAAGCFLPLSEQHDIRKTFGTRHRAALGLTEETDAVVMIVSEETGAISLAYDSKLYYDLSSVEIIRQLEGILELGSEFVPVEGTDNETKEFD